MNEPDVGVYGEMTDEVMAGLREIFGPDRVGAGLADTVISARDTYPRGNLWIRKGIVQYKPDCVVWPENTGEVSALLKLANERRVPVIPYGGGSGVCGGTIPLEGGIVCDLKRMNKILKLDDFSMSVVAGAGINGEIFERELNRKGHTLGHFPSSIYCSTLGGWLAARSAGQLSTLYGKIEDMVLAVEAVLPDGSVIRTNDAPRSATGPDIDQVIVGSEGTLAVITSATMKLKPLPERRMYASYLFPYITNGIEAMRVMMRSEVTPSAARLYDEVDTKIALGKVNVTGAGCLGVFLFDGYPERVEWEAEKTWNICMREGAKELGEAPARHWEESRYQIGYRQSQVLYAPGTVLDTIEVATVWSRITELYFAVKQALEPLCFVMAHFSHIYVEGGSIYFTCVAKSEDEAGDEELYRKIWDTAMEAVLEQGAAVSHHHGIGCLKAPYVEKQMGALANVYRRLKRELDPNNILNPGKMGL